VDVKQSLKGQYRAGLKMMRECVELCSDDVWVSGDHPRNFWRIAYHGLFYAHLYMMPTDKDFMAWNKHREDVDCLWENPPVVSAYSREEILEYLDFIFENVGGWVDALDLESPETGIPWYKNMTKLDHQIMNIRHLQGHVGQLSEILMANGVDEINWVGQA
jgi:hypothetical protein